MPVLDLAIKSAFGIPAVWIEKLALGIEDLAHVVGPPAGYSFVGHVV